jgi:hypothetical protein
MKKSKAEIPNSARSTFQIRSRDASAVIQKPLVMQIPYQRLERADLHAYLKTINRIFEVIAYAPHFEDTLPGDYKHCEYANSSRRAFWCGSPTRRIITVLMARADSIAAACRRNGPE